MLGSRSVTRRRARAVTVGAATATALSRARQGLERTQDPLALDGEPGRGHRLAAGRRRGAAQWKAPAVHEDHGRGRRQRPRRRDAHGGGARPQRQALQTKDDPDLRARASDVRLSAARSPEAELAPRSDIQGFVEQMRADRAAPSTVHNRLDPLRVIVRRAINAEELMIDPCAHLNMPAVRNNRTRIEAPATAEALIAALPESEQAFWALDVLRRPTARRAAGAPRQGHRLRRRAVACPSRLGRHRRRDRPEDIRRQARRADDG